MVLASSVLYFSMFYNLMGSDPKTSTGAFSSCTECPSLSNTSNHWKPLYFVSVIPFKQPCDNEITFTASLLQGHQWTTALNQQLACSNVRNRCLYLVPCTPALSAHVYVQNGIIIPFKTDSTKNLTPGNSTCLLSKIVNILDFQ